MRYVSASTFAYNIREKENLTRLISIESQPKKVVVVFVVFHVVVVIAVFVFVVIVVIVIDGRIINIIGTQS